VRRLRRSGWAGDGAAAVFSNEISAGLFINHSILDGLKPALRTACARKPKALGNQNASEANPDDPDLGSVVIPDFNARHPLRLE